MQEVTIPSRQVFYHYVTVDEGNKELCWNFYSRKKNVSFGLFRQQDASQLNHKPGKITLHSGGPSEIGTSYSVVQTNGAALAAAPSSPHHFHANSTASHSFSSRASVTSLGSQEITSTQSQVLSFTGNTTTTGTIVGGGTSSTGGQRTSVTARAKRDQKIEPPDSIPIMPIAHYDSAKTTIKGGHFVMEPGTYILVFDNSFSLKTSKKLFFFVALRDIEPREIVNRKEIEGWLLKKGKRSMQGYQRRWVEVHSSGVLTYYRTPGGTSHGSINLLTSAIRLNHDHLLIDIDSDQNTYHFKVEAERDFVRWTGLFEKFSHALMRAAQDQPNNVSSKDDLLLGGGGANASGGVGDNGSDMSNSIRGSMMGSSSVSLQSNIDSMHEKLSIVASTLRKELHKTREFVELSKGRTIENKTQLKDVQTLSTISDYISTLILTSTHMEEELINLKGNLRNQKDRALGSLQASDVAFHACLADNNRIRQKYGLDLISASKFLGTSADVIHGGAAGSEENRSIISHSNRTDDVFFDAEEGEESDDSSENYSMHDAIENVTIIEEDSDEASKGSVLLTPMEEKISNATIRARAGSLPLESHPLTTQSRNMGMSEPILEEEDHLKTPTRNDGANKTVTRRVKLPAAASSMENISIMGILRNNVGKDLSTVAMPIALNEPINLLQKLCEELEYCTILDKAASVHDPVDRLALIAGFVVSSYSSTMYRAARKPFNPLLGETFEFLRPDLGFKYISEKVSHHPPMMACHASSPNYIFRQDSLLKTKFWGKSMELNNVGTVHLEFPILEEHYTWQKVTTSMRNLFSTTRYLEHHGTITIKSKLTGHYCELVFKESGYFSSANNEVIGGIFSSDGNKIISVGGRWDQSLNKFSDASPNSLEVVWRVNSFPPNYIESYGFTKFAIELNELTPDLEDLLPITDTRYRPDQRLYEEGQAESAEQEKLRLEQKQRDSRKLLESNGGSWSPRFFELVDDPDSETGQAWIFKGNYWNQRETRRWEDKDLLDIFS